MEATDIETTRSGFLASVRAASPRIRWAISNQPARPTGSGFRSGSRSAIPVTVSRAQPSGMSHVNGAGYRPGPPVPHQR